MALVSSPENRFESIQGYDYPVSRVAVPGAAQPAAETPEMAYVDVAGDGPETFLCLHGEPTWGYLYRGGDGGDLTAAARERLREWRNPAFVLFSDGDPITRGAHDELRALLPTATRQPDVRIEDAGHYLQEDAPGEIADRIVAFVDRTDPPS